MEGPPSSFSPTPTATPTPTSYLAGDEILGSGAHDEVARLGVDNRPEKPQAPLGEGDGQGGVAAIEAGNGAQGPRAGGGHEAGEEEEMPALAGQGAPGDVAVGECLKLGRRGEDGGAGGHASRRGDDARVRRQAGEALGGRKEKRGGAGSARGGEEGQGEQGGQRRHKCWYICTPVIHYLTLVVFEGLSRGHAQRLGRFAGGFWWHRGKSGGTAGTRHRWIGRQDVLITVFLLFRTM